MRANTEQRNLAAIRFTDVVGDGELSRRNEALTLCAAQQGRQTIDRWVGAGEGEVSRRDESRSDGWESVWMSLFRPSGN